MHSPASPPAWDPQPEAAWPTQPTASQRRDKLPNSSSSGSSVLYLLPLRKVLVPIKQSQRSQEPTVILTTHTLRWRASGDVQNPAASFPSCFEHRGHNNSSECWQWSPLKCKSQSTRKSAYGVSRCRHCTGIVQWTCCAPASASVCSTKHQRLL